MMLQEAHLRRLLAQNKFSAAVVAVKSAVQQAGVALPGM